VSRGLDLAAQSSHPTGDHVSDHPTAEPLGARLRIGELARRAGVTSRTVRQYHAAGLLPEVPRDASGYRSYGPQDLALVLRIGRLKAEGRTVDEIARVLAAEPSSGQP
jgi:DNA-binding transcriptional MerR regulator